MQIQKWENCFRTVILSLFKFGFGLIHFRIWTDWHFGIGLAEVNEMLRLDIFSTAFRTWTHSMQLKNENVDKYIDNYLCFRSCTHLR